VAIEANVTGQGIGHRQTEPWSRPRHL